MSGVVGRGGSRTPANEPGAPGPPGAPAGAVVPAAPGVDDPAALARWMDEAGVSQGEQLRHVELIAGGRSNLTYRLDFSGFRLVLRRPPLGHVLPTAHDMGREYRVLTALAGSGIPVPRPVAFCSDPAVVGAPFYLMKHVTGVVLRTADDGADVTPAQARQLSELLVDTLAAIHAVDTDAAGLAGFGRPDGYLTRQLARWQRQWELSATRDMPGYDELVRRLTAGLPDSADATLLHGDFRLDNMLVTLRPAPAVAAVVDWEMSTLGDPLADLGLTLTYWADPGETDWLEINVGASVTALPGFLRRAEVAARYAELTGRDISGIGYYMAFGCFKLAVVLEGIHARFLQHKTVGEGFDRDGPAVPRLIGRAHELLDAGPLS